MDMSNRVCYMCEDYLKRGCLRCPCKHAKAALLFSGTNIEYDLAVSKLCLYLHHREKSNLPRLRNMVLYNGVAEDVINHLKSGGSSSCGFRGKSVYDVDSTNFPEAPPVFVRVNLALLLEHCLIGVSPSIPAYFVVSAFKQLSSSKCLKDLVLCNEDGAVVQGSIKAHHILTFPPGAESFPLVGAVSGPDSVALIIMLQPPET